MCLHQMQGGNSRISWQLVCVSLCLRIVTVFFQPFWHIHVYTLTDIQVPDTWTAPLTPVLTPTQISQLESLSPSPLFICYLCLFSSIWSAYVSLICLSLSFSPFLNIKLANFISTNIFNLVHPTLMVSSMVISLAQFMHVLWTVYMRQSQRYSENPWQNCTISFSAILLSYHPWICLQKMNLL